MANDLLLEIGCEEIPSRFMKAAMNQLKEEAKKILAEKRLEHGKIKAWGTPRRLVLLVADLAASQPDLVETMKGPPVDRAYDENGQPTKALTGFIKGQGIELEQVEEQLIKDAPYIVARKELKGQPAELILPVLLPGLIRKLNFPRPMYWQSKDVRFARPIRWLLALYNNKPLTFNYAGISSLPETYGHRFLAPGPHRVTGTENYFDCLIKNFIIVDQEQRREIIRAGLGQKAEEKGGRALIDEDLLEEVVYLVEYPVAIDGYFDETYLDLPKEVLVTTMQYHQRYFPLAEKDGDKLLPYFVGISNNLFHENIRKGYAKVIQARLADARFFFNEDCKQPLESYVEQLGSVVFLEALGTVDQKRLRLVELAGMLGETLALTPEQVDNARRVAHLCKADLVTGLVKEFTELQGTMGREYALLSGEPEEVAVGIYEHYLPRFTGDQLPSSREGAIVSLADRIDSLAGCFAIDLRPTGSQDPYALRRQAQGAVAILIGLELDLELKDYIFAGVAAIAAVLDLSIAQRDKISDELEEFFLQRLRFVFQESDICHDITEAVLAVPFKSVNELFKRASTLEEYLKGPLLDDVIIAYNRVANLARKAAATDIDESLFCEKAEEELYRDFKVAENIILKTADTVSILEALQTLKAPIDQFFDNVMVMADDQKTRDNRLSLLAAIKQIFNRLADFSRLQAP